MARKKGTKRAAKSKPARTAEARGANDKALREHLVNLLAGGQAYADVHHIIAELPEAQRGVKPAGAPHTAWQLLEHLRIAQWDILGFSRNPKHVSPHFPEGYWPASETPPSADAWDKSVAAVERDLAEMKKLVSNPKANLFAPIAHGTGQTILREALLVADHNAYHLGQMVLLRRLLGAWAES
ncbi:MAG TPA: DinB family protein [Candidatus Limnocylindrales bacterium]|nr:DinB family protein [Candidatus Limnocylindrales bacterium]